MSIPPRRAVLYIEAPDGKLIPLKAMVSPDSSNAVLSIIVENNLRAFTATVPSSDVWFIPSNITYAFKTLTVEGYLRVEGTVKVKDILDVKGTLDLEGGVVDVGWP